jgi:hypothetical protein
VVKNEKEFKKMKFNKISFAASWLMLFFLTAPAAFAQTTVFTYQGRLMDGGTPANGTYEIQFTLWDATAGGTQLPQPAPVIITRSNVQVTAGLFSVLPLDFGALAFPGADRFLEINVRRTALDPFTTLSPRQQITSTPYAIRSLTAETADTATNATQLSGVDAARFVQSDAGGSVNIAGGLTVGGSFVGIGTTSPQTRLQVKTATGLYGFTHTDGAISVGSYVGSSSSGAFGGWLGTQSNHKLFFFTGNGQPTMTVDTTGNVGIGTFTPASKFTVAGLIETTTGGVKFPDGTIQTTAGGGGGAGIVNQTTQQSGANFNIDGTGTANIFNAQTQYNVGGSRVLGSFGNSGNLFVGIDAGRNNSSQRNTFVGVDAGEFNTIGDTNAFFGWAAGNSNSSGGNNTLVGALAGLRSSTGDFNSFFGAGTGFTNTTGSRNTFLGVSAGDGNTTGSSNTIIGTNANIGATNLTNANAIGAAALVSTSNSMVLGSINGVNSATADTDVGIGTTAPKARLDVTGGNILVGTPGQGIVLKSPDGLTCKLLSIDNAGAMALSAIACP